MIKNTVLTVVLLNVFLFSFTANSLTCTELIKKANKVYLPTEYYSSGLITGIKAGDTIKFQDNQEYLVQRVISVNNADGIFEIPDNRVLRVPLKNGAEYSRVNTVNQTLDGYDQLLEAGVPVPRILDYTRGTRILVEKIDISFHFVDLFDGQVKLSKQHLLRVQEEFSEFVKKFYRFNSVGDMHKGQIVYSSDRGWLLLDWKDFHRLGNNVNPFIHCFWDMTNLPNVYDRDMVMEWWRSSDLAIAAARNQNPESYFKMDYWEAESIIRAAVR
ncbi:MAG: hypothetical protein JNM39_12880 [Bdellovibrionaceae bacterium]|nr:hypothetical protein [Pseudobdellovibrionaceae bacterium]